MTCNKPLCCFKFCSLILYIENAFDILHKSHPKLGLLYVCQKILKLMVLNPRALGPCNLLNKLNRNFRNKKLKNINIEVIIIVTLYKYKFIKLTALKSILM